MKSENKDTETLLTDRRRMGYQLNSEQRRGKMGRKEQAEHVWENSAAADIKRIRKDDPEYPELLRQIDRPPEVLYCMGNTELLKKKCVAVVGARKASSYGKWAAYNIGKRLAEYGIVTVSGLAYGCDAEAHRGALEADGDTIAVMGCGVDICYPRNSRTLRDRIARQGLILSEYPPGTQPRTWMFPQRNRIISGISEAVAVAGSSGQERGLYLGRGVQGRQAGSEL